MKDWMLDIKNEAQNLVIPAEDQIDWWTSLFAEVWFVCNQIDSTLMIHAC